MRTTLALALALVLVACGGEGVSTTPPKVATADSAGASLEKSPDSGQVDRVGPDDGALKADGVKDLSFVCQVQGPLSAIFLVSVDDKGAPSGQFQADTLSGQNEGPRELTAYKGKATPGIGVVVGDKLVNAADGSLPELAAGPHRLVLYVAPSPAIQPGSRLRVYVQRPDKSLVGGATITN